MQKQALSLLFQLAAPWGIISYRTGQLDEDFFFRHLVHIHKLILLYFQSCREGNLNMRTSTLKISKEKNLTGVGVSW
tara:strand:+ start:914 stop:1144 length:231 start_codon:yes stop_codon:yes gene_type:complete